MPALNQTRWMHNTRSVMVSILMVSGVMCFTVSRHRLHSARRGVNDIFWRSRQATDAFYQTPNHSTSQKHTNINDYNLRDNIISSPQSLTVKKFQAILSKRKKRREYGQTVVEGPRMVFDLLQNPRTENLVRHILISTDDFREQYEDRLRQLPSCVAPNIQLVTPAILKACSDTITPQGIVALVDIPNLAPSGAVSTQDKKFPFYLVLDGVSDPGNVGTLLRSSLAVGASGVLLLPECCDVWNPKAVRSAMGASFQLPIVEVCSWDKALVMLTKEWNVKQIYAATMMEDSNAEDDVRFCSFRHYDIDWLDTPSALVIGSEGNGLSENVRNSLMNPGTNDNHRIEAVHVPMHSGIESLNAAVCGSVIMFEYSRQCQQSRT